MNWGLKQGMIGRAQRTLQPSTASLGGNTYLSQYDFLKMIAIALLLHGTILGIASLWPEERVTDIPVRALTFKIGNTEHIAAYAPAATPVQPQAVQPAPAPVPVARPAPQPVKQAKIIPLVPPAQRQVPSENIVTPPPQPVAIPTPAPKALPDTNILTQRAIAPSPQRFIREPVPFGQPTGSVGGQAAENTMTAANVQAVREKYELEISGWIQRHKLYPAAANGREGRAVVRMRIDRTGAVRYYAIEESAGSDVLDAAAIDMVRRANPLPPVPASYPAGNLIEFLIPIVFRVPR